MAWADGGRVPRPLADVTEQLAIAAAADFTSRLAELVVCEPGVGGSSAHGDGSDATPVLQRGRSGSGVDMSDKDLEKAEVEELAVLRSRMNALATQFADKFMASVDEQVMAVWKSHREEEQTESGDTATIASTASMKKVRAHTLINFLYKPQRE